MQQKLEGIRDEKTDIEKTDYLKIIKEEERSDDDDQPVAEESKQFWGNIWSQSADHKKDAKWLQDL